MLDALPYVVVGWLFLIGCLGIATSHNYVHAIVCLSLVQSSTYLLLLAVGWSRHGTAPVFADVSTTSRVVDPVVQAMTLTDVVVGAAVTALLLALAIQLTKAQGTLDPDEVRSLEEESEEQ
jgi:multicomponent Na+:H+ antiporter subunit C